MNQAAEIFRNLCHPRTTAVFAQLFWAALAACHVPAVYSIGSDLVQESVPTSLWRFALISISVLFFAGKAVDVRWLRLPNFGSPQRNRKLCVACWIVVALLHADIKRIATTELPDNLISADWLVTVAPVTATLFLAERVRRGLLRIHDVVCRAALSSLARFARFCKAASNSHTATLQSALHRLRCLIAISCSAHRAPPQPA